MEINVRFDNDISERIAVEIAKAKKSIKCAIAWFTDAELEKLIGLKSNLLDGIILNDDSINNKLSFGSFQSKVFYSDLEHGLMHHKFCIIDDKTLITGSYNWTTKARYYNKENIIIIEDEKIVKEFLKQYDELKENATQKKGSELNNINGEIENDELFDLEKTFNSEIEDKIEKIKQNRTREFRGLGDLAEKWVAQNTGVVAARKLMLIQDEFPSGFLKLAELGKLNLSFEESVIKNKYSALFQEKIKSIAFNRLKKLEYFKSDIYSIFQTNDYFKLP